VAGVGLFKRRWKVLYLGGFLFGLITTGLQQTAYSAARSNRTPQPNRPPARCRLNNQVITHLKMLALAHAFKELDEGPVTLVTSLSYTRVRSRGLWFEERPIWDLINMTEYSAYWAGRGINVTTSEARLLGGPRAHILVLASARLPRAARACSLVAAGATTIHAPSPKPTPPDLPPRRSLPDNPRSLTATSQSRKGSPKAACALTPPSTKTRCRWPT
jgi:hypothetical protein